MKKLTGLIRWLAALAVAVGFFVGVPYLLWQVAGSPLPDAGTTLSGVMDMLFTSQGVADSTVIKVAVVIAWLAWVHLVYVSLREVVSTLRATVPPAIRGGSFTQRLVRPIIKTLFYMGGMSSSVLSMAPVAGASPAGVEQVVVPLSEGLSFSDGQTADRYLMASASSTVLEVVGDGSGGFVDAADAARRDALIPGAVLYEVVEGDNLWDIAEAHLGDGFRWKEIFEQSGDYDQAEGGRLVDQDMIHSRWILQLPEDAVDVPEPDASLVERVFGLVGGVADGAQDVANEVVDDVSDEELEEAAVEQVDGETNDATDEVADDSAVAESDVSAVVIVPVDDFDVDAEPADDGPLVDYSEEEMGAEPSEVVAPGGDVEIETPVAAVVPVEVELPVVDTDDSKLVVAGLAAAGLLGATGLAGYFARKRRLTMRDRGVGEQPVHDADGLAAERTLTGGGSAERAAWLYAAFDSVTNRGDMGEPLSPPAIFQMGNVSALEAVFVPSGSRHVPAPWNDQSGTGQVWELATDTPIGDLRVQEAYDWGAPATVCAGTGVWLNLEWFGLAAVKGVDEEVGEWLRALCSDLRHSPAQSVTELLVSDTLVERFGPLVPGEDGWPVADFAPALGALIAGMQGDEDFDAYNHRISTSQGDRFAPAILLVDAAEVDQIEELIELGSRKGSPVVVLVVGDLDTPHVFTVQHNELKFILGELEQVFAAAAMSLQSIAAFETSLEAIGRTEPIPVGPQLEAVESPEPLDFEDGWVEEADDVQDVEDVEQVDDDTEAIEVDGGAPDWFAENAAKSGAAVLVTSVEDDVVAEPVSGDVTAEVAEADASRGGRVEVLDYSPGADADNETAAEPVIDLTNDSADVAQFMLNLLGDVEFVGEEIEMRLGGKKLPLVAYLAVNGPTTGEVLRKALYPDREPADSKKAFESLLLRARKALRDHLPSTKDGVYSIEGVGCDWPVAMGHLNAARGLDGDEAKVELAAGLGLVRGVPVSNVDNDDGSWDWFYDHDLGLMSSIEVAVSEAALRLSVMLRGDGDLEHALEACQKGRMVSSHWTHLAKEHVLVLLLMGRREEAQACVSDWEFHDEELTGDEPSREVRQVMKDFDTADESHQAVG